MASGIDQLAASLVSAHPQLTVSPQNTGEPAADEGAWVVRHPNALTDVQVLSATGDAPFTVQSDFSSPTVVKSVEDAAKLVVTRLGLRIGGRQGG